MRLNFLKSLDADDIFISYSRRDGSAYLTGLDAALSQQGFSCFTDKRGTDAGRLPPETLYRKVRSCKTLVLLASPGAQERPENITPELQTFAEHNGTSRIICVSFDGGVEFDEFPDFWEHFVVGKAREREAPEALTTGTPSPAIVAAVVAASDYMKSKDRLRKYRNRAVGVLGALVVAIAVAAVIAAIMFQRAAVETGKATAATTKANAETERAAQATQDAERALLQAFSAQTEALTTGLAAELSRADAEEQKRLAQLATDKAEVQTKLAEAAAQKARTATEQAKLAQDEASRQQSIADARALANRSGTTLLRRPEEASRSLVFAVASMKKSAAADFHSVEADTALRESLALFPRLRESYEVAKGNEATDDVQAVALSPDGRHFATLYKGEKLRVYVTATRALLREFDCQCSQVALSSGAASAAAQTEKGVELIDLKDGSRRTLPSVSAPELIALSPGGRYLAFTVKHGEDLGTHSSLSVLDVAKGRLVQRLDYYEDNPGDLKEGSSGDEAQDAKTAEGGIINMLVHDLAFGPTGDLAAGGRYLLPEGSRFVGRVAIWRLGFDPKLSSAERELTDEDFGDHVFIPQSEEVRAVAPGIDGTSFATEMGVWKRSTGRSAYESIARLGYRLPEPYEANINKLAFGPDGQTVTLFRKIEGEQREQENDEVVLETWDAAGHWEFARAYQSEEAANLGFEPRGEAVAAVSEYLAFGEPGGIAWSPESTPPADLKFEFEPEREVRSVNQTADFVVNADDKVAVLWDVWARKKRTLTLDGRLHEVDAAAVSPGGRFVALSGKDKQDRKSFVIYQSKGDTYSEPKVIPQHKVREDVSDDEEEPDAGEDEGEGFNILRLSLSADGRRLAALYSHGETFVRVWDVERAEDISPPCLKEHAGRADKGCLALVPNEMLLSPDGRFLAATDDDQTVLLDLSKGRAAELKGLLDDTSVNSLAFSRNGRYLGVGSVEGIVHVFETRRPDDEIARLHHTGEVTGIAFSDDGRRIATASAARNSIEGEESYPIRIWHLQPDALLEEAARRLEDLRRAGRMTGR